MRRVFRFVIAILLVAIFTLSFTACGGGSSSPTPTSTTESTSTSTPAPHDEIAEHTFDPVLGNDGLYNLDYELEEMQEMSSERLSTETIRAFVNWMKEELPREERDELTYVKLLEYIGCDPSDYKFDFGKRTYEWRTEENEYKYFSVTFKLEDGIWVFDTTHSSLPAPETAAPEIANQANSEIRSGDGLLSITFEEAKEKIAEVVVRINRQEGKDNFTYAYFVEAFGGVEGYAYTIKETYLDYRWYASDVGGVTLKFVYNDDDVLVFHSSGSSENIIPE